MNDQRRSGLRGAGARARVATYAVVVALFSPVLAAGRAASQPSACANLVACENQLSGVPQSVWDVAPVADPTIEGFADDESVNAGQTINFKVTTPASAYHIDIYRLGYYGGDGARLVTTLSPSVRLPQTQPPCRKQLSTGLIDCGNWAVSASWNVPDATVSGVFIADLIRDDGVTDARYWSQLRRPVATAPAAASAGAVALTRFCSVCARFSRLSAVATVLSTNRWSFAVAPTISGLGRAA